MPLNGLKDEGMESWKKFPFVDRYSRAVQLPILLGISPENILLETSNTPKFLKFPNSEGRAPVKRVSDRSREIDKDAMLKTSGGMGPLRLLRERSKKSKFWHFPRLEGMLP